MKKRKISKSNVILLIGGIVVMIPVIALAVILLSASKDSSKPIEGKRFNNERTVEVSKTQLSSLEKDISTISSVEKVQIELTTATVRIYADIKNEVESNSSSGDIFVAAAADDSRRAAMITYYSVDKTASEKEVTIDLGEGSNGDWQIETLDSEKTMEKQIVTVTENKFTLKIKPETVLFFTKRG